MGSSDIEQQDGTESGRTLINLWSRTKEALDRFLFKLSIYIPLTLVAVFLVALIIPCALVSPLAMMLLFSFLDVKNMVNIGLTSPKSSSSSSLARIYDQSRLKETFFHRVLLRSLSLLARCGLLLLLWLIFNVSVPGLKKSTLLGSPTWKWSLLAVVLTSAYFVSMMIYLLPGACKTMVLKIYHLVKELGGGYSHPYLNLYSGFFPNVTLVIYFVIVLVTWLVYFRSNDGLRAGPVSVKAIEYVTWTWVSLFVGSILLLLKTILLLKWSARAIYRRFEPMILITGIKFVYLGVLIGGFYEDQIVRKFLLFKGNDLDALTNNIMSEKSDIAFLQDTGRLLATLAANVGPLKEDGVPDVVQFFEKNITQTSEKCDMDRLEDLLNRDSENELFARRRRLDIVRILYYSVKEQCASDEFTYDDFKKWMVDAHKNCVNMGRTLADANAAVTHLNIFISFIIWIIVVLFWLLITGIATTTVLVTIATPFLALTFIFGDTAKIFFQGIIFCFATHAFDVGDRCIIEDTELEVKSIGILTTVFIKIGTLDKRMYPNSLLATKAIVNLGWKPDPTDVVELTLDFSTSPTKLQSLETKLQKFFNDPQQKGVFETSHEVMIKEIGDKIKVTIHYKHVLSINEMTHGECFKKKNKQRSILLKKIYQLLDDHYNPQALAEQVIPVNQQAVSVIQQAASDNQQAAPSKT